MPDVFVSPKERKETVNKNQKSYVPGLERGGGSPLGSFSYFPHNVKFVGTDSKEKIVLFLRRHPITNVGWILLSIIMFASPMILDQFPILDFLPENFKFVAILGWYLIAIAFTFESFLDWFFSVYIVTDERIFDVDFVNLIYREISEANLDQIQDVTTKMGGVVRTVFDYGDIFIQTASEVPNIEFDAVPHPDKVAKTLRELRVEEEQEKIEGRVR